MITAYIGCILIATGTVIALVEFFGRYRELPQHHQDRAKALGIGLIGFGTMLTLHSTIEAFAADHFWLAVLALICVIAIIGITLTIPLLITRRVPIRDLKTDDGPSSEEDQERDDVGSLGNPPGREEERDQQGQDHVDGKSN